jgi:transposase
MGPEPKTDKINATLLAKLFASGFLPEVWVPDARIEAMRREMTRRTQLVRQRTRRKNILQCILHTHLVPPCPHGDLFGKAGRGWLAGQWLPEDERVAVERHVRELDRLGAELSGVKRDIARRALEDAAVKRLMTVPGIDMVVAVSLAAAIGDVGRFAAPERLVAHLGLNPSVHPSGESPLWHGRITKQGRGQARGMLVEAAWAAARSPGPLRAFFRRISARRGQHVAAVATARKMAIVVWHMLRICHMLHAGKDYTWARPALHAKQLRDLELRTEHQPPRPARRRPCLQPGRDARSRAASGSRRRGGL